MREFYQVLFTVAMILGLVSYVLTKSQNFGDHDYHG